MKAIMLTALVLLLGLLVARASSSARIVQPNKCTSYVMYDCLEKELPRLEGLVCVNDTEEFLTRKLKDVGGYNPRYVAANLYEALTFEDPSSYYFQKTTLPARKRLPGLIKSRCGKSYYLPGHPCYQVKFTSTPQPYIENNHTKPIGEHSKLPKPTPAAKALRHAKKTMEWPLEETDHPELTVPWAGRRRREARVRRMAGERVQGCYGKGTRVLGNNRYHTCSTCHIISTLPSNQFPRYLNEAVCRHSLAAHASGGQKDETPFCFANAGYCAQKIIKSAGLILEGYKEDPVLSKRMGKSVLVQKWKETTLSIRSCCDCEIYDSTKQLLGIFGKK
ncbi:predicted protein [Nematostella vectensis]|uniref:Uncharacterized protein n=1 Tax=Nematostella vectensis TaxID=45351 RepID=A7SBG1_NEMVE|nr:predicted protein [Nematostella vectensis]|eukprot:XP_001630977.1 predicted protein [Nematostella vectensis]